MNTTITKTQPSKLPDGWEWVNVKCLYKPISPKRKLNLKEYLKEGAFPIVDQSKGLVGGYHNNASDVNVISSPVVIFGDHTTEIKYVDFDFVTGADGTKILQPDPSKIFPLFFYFALQNIGLKTDGYRRHFKDLNKKMIPFPPLDEQKRIAAKLNEQMDTVWEARKEAEEQLQAAKVLPSAYLKQVFPSNEDDLPNGWKWVKLGEVANFFDRMRKPVNEPERRMRTFGKKEPELFPYYGANGQLGWIDDFIFDFPTILLAEDGGHFGSSQKPVSYIVNGKYWVNNHAHVIRPKDGVDLEYLHYSIMIRPDLQTSGSTVPKLNQRMAREIILPLPPLEEQKWIATKLKKQMMHATELTEVIEQELDLIKALPASILKKTLAGEP